jgi:photosystem II stability/assembly factor-like uncharacterized protein
MHKHTITLLLLVCSTAILFAQPTDLNTALNPVKWRNIGPHRGGRSVAACGVVGQPNVYYMGVTGGGLWKTDDMGLTWANVSDGYFKTGSVGAVAVPETDPNIVYVGMGEHAVRGVMTHHGDGFYKSIDAGKTWEKMVGPLDATQHIARIVVHPTDPKTLWVAAQGALYGKSKDRGIYKSTDGGKTWRNTLYINDMTGCNELSINYANPNVLYASMWEHGRKPWQVISGGSGSGLYKSIDGGETWDKMKEGLPTEMGKMAIAVCRSNPDKVYALIESDSDKEAGGLFVSDDAGGAWSRITNDHRLVQRAWYYIELFVDPKNDQLLYVLSAPMLRSTDGGKTWEDVSNTHGDYHDLWINPHNGKNMVVADDGGAAVTFNGGKTWSAQDYPTAQMYRINADNQFPYRIYGGQQDNSSVVISHRDFGYGGIGKGSWGASAGGESAFLAFDPDDPRYVLGGSYQGTIDVLDTKAKASTNIMAAPIQYLGLDAKDIKYRFNWNAPIVWDPHLKNTYYHGSQHLLATSDMGRTWREISPDLTRNEKEKQGKGGVPYTNEAVGAENYGTLAYVTVSPHEAGVIWTGSDDGLVHITMDGGKNWRNATPKGLSECLVNAIEVSPHDKATAYIATTRYKFNDHTPALYKTTDYGKTWTKISDGLPSNAFTRVVREDNVRRDLLFAGTELGVFASWNGGKTWVPLQINLPIAPVTDLKVHQNDLIAATSGRSFWILDDLGLLRQLEGTMPSANALYAPENAILANGGSPLNKNSDDFKGSSFSEGINPANGIVFYYNLAESKPNTIATLSIKTEKGAVVHTFNSVKDSLFQPWDGSHDPAPVLGTKKGINRFVWDMRYPSMKGIQGVYIESSFGGHKASPGKYTATLQYDAFEQTQTFEIKPNPLYRNTIADYEQYHTIMMDMENKVRTMHEMVDDMAAKRQQLEEITAHLGKKGGNKALQATAEALVKKMTAWDEDMIQRKSKAYDDVENFPNRFTADYLFLINQTESDIPVVNQPSMNLKVDLDKKWAVLEQRGKEILEKELTALNKLLWEAGIGGVWK